MAAKIFADDQTELVALTKENQLATEASILTDKDKAQAVVELVDKEKAAKEAIDGTTEAIVLSEEEQAKLIVTQKQNANVLEMLQNNYGLTEEQALAFAKSEGMLKSEIEETTDVIDDQTDSVDDLRSSFSKLLNTLFDGINASNDFQEAQWALEEAQKAVEEAEKKLEKAQKATGSTLIVNNDALNSYLSTNIDYLENQQKQQKAQERLNEIVASGDTSSLDYLKAVESLNNAQAEGNKIVEEAAKKTGAYVSTGKQTEAQIKATTEATKEYEQKINELDSASLDYLETAYQVYTSIFTTKEAQEEARKKAIEYGLQLVETGKWGEEAFVSMAQQFGLSSDEIIEYAGDMGLKLDYATRNRILGVDTKDAMNNIWNLRKEMDSIQDKEVTLKVLTSVGGAIPLSLIKSTGGIVGYAGGGIIGHDGAKLPNLYNIPKAQSGYVVPQTGRPIPVLAHEGEIIANTSQQRNLAEWIMNKANTRPNSNGTLMRDINIYSPEPLTPAEIARQTKNTLRLIGLEAALQ